MMKKLIVFLLLVTLFGCKSKIKEEIKEPEYFEDTLTSTKQAVHYVMPFADKDGNMVIPLSCDLAIITTDETKSKFMQDAFDSLIIYYHQLLDPSHEFNNVNNIKTINDNYGKGAVKVDPALIEVIENAIELSSNTDGYFNPTMGAVSDVWKNLFTEEHKNSDPNNVDVENALTCVIPCDKLKDYIIIDKENSTVTFKKYEQALDKVIIDLGAYSKGYVLDKAYESLLKYKTGFLLSAGGSSIITYVHPTQDKLNWTIGVKNPNSGESAFLLSIKNSFISSSGDEQQYFINEEGIRRHHILNPYTGYPENRFRSITLVSESNAGILDSLSTAMYSKEDIYKKIEESYSLNIKKALIKENNNKGLVLEYDKSIEEYIEDIDTNQIVDAICLTDN